MMNNNWNWRKSWKTWRLSHTDIDDDETEKWTNIQDEQEHDGANNATKVIRKEKKH